MDKKRHVFIVDEMFKRSRKILVVPVLKETEHFIFVDKDYIRDFETNSDERIYNHIHAMRYGKTNHVIKDTFEEAIEAAVAQLHNEHNQLLRQASDCLHNVDLLKSKKNPLK